MRFDLDDLNPPVWFDHPKNNARIQVRTVSVEELERIRKKTVKRRTEYRRGQRFEVEDTNDKLERELTWDYSIVDWEGILDASESPIECTTENKVLLMTKAPGFAGWVTNCLEQLNQDFGERQESAEKNL